MAIQGVKGNVFEILLSADKKVQDFMASLTAGDSLRGRVVEIIPDGNKAIINFKGYNLMSQLPADSTIQKGDTINVIVSQMDNRIFMKIDAAAAGKNIDVMAGGSNVMSVQQLISVLEGLKIPVNELNIFIAQKLADYHLPVTKENIFDINSTLNSYLRNRGIDARAFNLDSADSVKALIFSNFFRLGLELQKAAESLRNMALVMESRGTQVMTRNDFAIRSANTLNILSAAAAATGGAAQLSSDAGGIIMSLSNPDNKTMSIVLDSAVKEGVITQQQAETAIKALSGQAASVALGNDIMISRQGSKVDIKYAGVTAAIESLTAQGSGQAIAGLREAAANGIFDTKPAAGMISQAAIKPDSTGLLSSHSRAMLAEARDIFSSLNKNVLMPENTNLSDNAKETSRLLKSFEAALSGLLGSGDLKGTKIQDQLRSLATGAAWSVDASRTALKNLNILNEEGTAGMKAQDYGKYQTIMKDLIFKITGMDIFKLVENVPAAAQDIIKPAELNLPVDIESSIDALVFLKSRNLPSDNMRMIDVMSNYFKNDLKLSRSMENMNSSLNNFEVVLKNLKNSQPEVKNVMQVAAELKNIINSLSIRTGDSNLKAGIIDAQLRSFLNKSGLNLEYSLLSGGVQPHNLSYSNGRSLINAKNNYSQPAEVNAGGALKQAGFSPGNTMKAKVLEFLEKLGGIGEANISAQQKQAVKIARESAGEILTNLTALQLMNQRPVSFDMAYTQLPVFFNNKLFNGELQVWYRKDAPKEDLKNLNVPVNMVFMLNTSNLGPVKVSMTVYKNEVECTVKAESEKAKQALMRSKNEFLGSLESLKLSVKNLNIQLEEAAGLEPPESGEGYINMGRINIQA